MPKSKSSPKTVYIALDYMGNTLGVIAATSREAADAFFQGKDIYPHRVLVPDLADPAYPVLELVKVKKVRLSALRDRVLGEVYIVEQR